MIGHSYVRDFARLNRTRVVLEDNTEVNVKYCGFPGASYQTFLNDPSLLQAAFEYCPDYTIVILAGNSFRTNNTNADVYCLCKKFYKLIRDNLPSTVLIAAQAESRYLNPSFHSLPPSDYIKRRDAFNRFLKRFCLKDFILQVSGPGRLDNVKYYRDNVHLNRTGQLKYLEYIVKTLSYCRRSRQ